MNSVDARVEKLVGRTGDTDAHPAKIDSLQLLPHKVISSSPWALADQTPVKVHLKAPRAIQLEGMNMPSGHSRRHTLAGGPSSFQQEAQDLLSVLFPHKEIHVVHRSDRHIIVMCCDERGSLQEDTRQAPFLYLFEQPEARVEVEIVPIEGLAIDALEPGEVREGPTCSLQPFVEHWQQPEAGSVDAFQVGGLDPSPIPLQRLVVVPCEDGP